MVLPKFAMGNNGAPDDTKVFRMNKLTCLLENRANKSLKINTSQVFFFQKNIRHLK